MIICKNCCDAQQDLDRLRHDITGYDAVKRTMQAEIDRLRAELVELRPYCETLNRRLMEAGDELKRLRAENMRLQKLVDAYEQSRKRPPSDFELQGF